MIVYRHRRLDTNEIFYIGIGVSKKRAYRKDNRSVFWKNIINKTNYSVEILCENISKEEAVELEMFLISLYGRKDLGKGNLVNLTEGGEGTIGVKQSKETIEKRKNSRKSYIVSNDTCNKISKTLTGRTLTEEHKKNLSRPMKETTKELLRIKNTGKIISKETRDKISEKLKGQNNPFYGKKHSEETLKQISKIVLQFSLEGILIKEWKSIQEVQRDLNLFSANVSRCCSGERKTSGGFIWKFKKENNE